MERDQQPVRLDKRVEKMDMELKEFFAVQRDFISVALAGLEKRLGDRLSDQIDGLGTRVGKLETRFGTLETRVGSLEVRLDKMDRDMKAAFAGMDAKLSILIERGDLTPPRRRVKRRG